MTGSGGGPAGTISPKPIAKIDPTNIPEVRKIETNIPTDSLRSSGAALGALTAQRVDTYPFEKANTIILIILNQSAFIPKSQEGGTLNAIKMNVTTKMSREYDKIIPYLSFS